MAKEAQVDDKDSGVYIKPSKNFKLPSDVKSLLGTITDPHQRGSFKRAMIQAILLGQRRVGGGGKNVKELQIEKDAAAA